MISVRSIRNEKNFSSYDSFAADWGPGPVVKKAFEADCNCELKLVALEDGVSQLQSASKAFLTTGPGPQSAAKES